MIENNNNLTKHQQKILDMIQQFVSCANLNSTKKILTKQRRIKSDSKQNQYQQSQQQKVCNQINQKSSGASQDSQKQGKNTEREQASLLMHNKSLDLKQKFQIQEENMQEQIIQKNDQPKIFSKQIKQFFRQKLSFSEILEQLNKCCENWSSNKDYDDLMQEQKNQLQIDVPKLLYFFDVCQAPKNQFQLPNHQVLSVQIKKQVKFMLANQYEDQCCIIDTSETITIYDTKRNEKLSMLKNQSGRKYTVATWASEGAGLLLGTSAGSLVMMINCLDLKQFYHKKVHEGAITAIQQVEKYIYTSGKDQILLKISRRTQQVQWKIRCHDFSALIKLPGRGYSNFIFGLYDKKKLVMVDQMLEFQSEIFIAESESDISQINPSPSKQTIFISVSKKSPEIHEINPLTRQCYKRITIATVSFRNISTAFYDKNIIAVSFASNKIKYYGIKSWKLLYTYQNPKNTKIQGLGAIYDKKKVFGMFQKGFGVYSTEIKQMTTIKTQSEIPRHRSNIQFLSILRSLGPLV